jgi:hypothetical protein
MKLRHVAVCVSLISLAVTAVGSDTTIQIINKSQWEIHHLYLSPHASDDWGPDQLGKVVLETGDDFTVTNVPCGKYDIKVVDEDGDSCVIENQRLCGEDGSVWKITDEELLDCENED